MTYLVAQAARPHLPHLQRERSTTPISSLSLAITHSDYPNDSFLMARMTHFDSYWLFISLSFISFSLRSFLIRLDLFCPFSLICLLLHFSFPFLAQCCRSIWSFVLFQYHGQLYCRYEYCTCIRYLKTFHSTRTNNEMDSKLVRKSEIEARARIFKRLWSPGIDSKVWIPPAYVAWRAGTITLFLLGS